MKGKGRTHAYDQGGNRLTKTDSTNARRTVYYYDVGEPSTYQTRNNRLMYYETFDLSDPQTPALRERVFYEYSEDVQAGRQGNPTTIVWETPQPSGPAAFRAIDLQYNHSGELWLAIRRRWSGGEDCAEVIDGITEFRGSGRARRLVRQRSVSDSRFVLPDSTRWTDYDGDEAYADYAMTLDPQTGAVSPVPTTAYLPGVGQMDMQTGAVSYTHGDQIGTLRAVSGSVFAGSPPARVTRRLVFTAFGEKVYDGGSGGSLSPEDTRYQYAGAWGYESDAEQGLPFLHVGYRYYDPSTGRFVQRDPIGIAGGLNVYEYVDSTPTDVVDPLGLAAGTTMTPQGLVACLEADIAQSGSSVVSLATRDGVKKYVVRSVMETAEPSGRVTYQFFHAEGTFTWTVPGNAMLNVTKTSKGVVVEGTKGACGVCGAEAIPMIVLYLRCLRRRRNGHSRKHGRTVP